MFNFFHFADFKNLLELRQEERLLDAVSEGPVLEQTLKQGDGQCAILREEEHRASQQLLVELTACLHLVQWDDHILEENHVLVSERHGEAGDDGGEDVEKLSGTVELVRLVDQGVEALVDGLSDHLSPWHQLH